MKHFRLLAFSAIVAIAVLVGIQSDSYALSVAFYDSSFNILKTIVDNGVGDANSAPGIVSFNGQVGSWLINASTGDSKPYIGSALVPTIQFISTDVAFSNSGTLYVGLYDNNFTGNISGASALPFQLSVNGSTTGGVQFFLYGDDSNTNPLNLSTNIASLGPFSGNNFSGTMLSSPFTAAAPYGLTVLAEITPSSGPLNITSFNMNLNPIPEPATLLLMGFGSGIMGGGIKRLRKKFRKNEEVVA